MQQRFIQMFEKQQFIAFLMKKLSEVRFSACTYHMCGHGGEIWPLRCFATGLTQRHNTETFNQFN